MKNIDFKKIFKRETNKIVYGPTSAWPINFVRDWKSVVLVFGLGLISLSFFAWQIYLSDRLAGGYLTPTIENSDLTIRTINSKKLQADILLLKNKQAEYLELKANNSKLVDPSL